MHAHARISESHNNAHSCIHAFMHYFLLLNNAGGSGVAGKRVGKGSGAATGSKRSKSNPGVEQSESGNSYIAFDLLYIMHFTSLPLTY